MKKTMKIYMAAALLAVVSPAILAQAPVKVVCNELKQKGNELVIDAVITVDGSRIKSRENLSLTPVLEAEHPVPLFHNRTCSGSARSERLSSTAQTGLPSYS